MVPPLAGPAIPCPVAPPAIAILPSPVPSGLGKPIWSNWPVKKLQENPSYLIDFPTPLCTSAISLSVPVILAL